uniref:Ig-like domain-containing protein n=1 Tax=Haplochromis burtoni TaxID=8153 RepID=A0A3Q2VUB8_HAPBU
MMNLVFVSGWISVSGSEFQTVEVQSGEEVTLQCSNISRSSTHTEWFRVVNRAMLSCIASMYGSNGQASFCDGFQNGKFNMTSNNVAVFLQIKPVDLSDAGLYFCGFFLDYHIIISTRVQTTQPLSIILAGLTGLLTMVVIILVLKIRKLQTGKCGYNYVHLNSLIFQNMSSGDLNYAALSFQKKAKRSCGPTTRDLEPHVIYAATR